GRVEARTEGRGRVLDGVGLAVIGEVFNAHVHLQALESAGNLDVEEGVARCVFEAGCAGAVLVAHVATIGG
nr:hypothetical protein [Tanacetum cinerariifolium]